MLIRVIFVSFMTRLLNLDFKLSSVNFLEIDTIISTNNLIQCFGSSKGHHLSHDDIWIR